MFISTTDRQISLGSEKSKSHQTSGCQGWTVNGFFLFGRQTVVEAEKGELGHYKWRSWLPTGYFPPGTGRHGCAQAF